MSRELLLEIGTEEIPADFMSGIFSNLSDLAANIFAEERVDIGEIRTTGTPRRIVLYIEDVVEKQSDLEKEIRGPAKSIAYDEAGNLTKAGNGFARGQGIAPEKLEIRDTKDGEYVFASMVEQGEKTVELLPVILEKLIKNLNFPKAMRWGDKDTKFIRPVRWLMAFYGAKNIEFEFAGVKSDNWSRGHRFLSKGKIEVATADEYFATLEEEYVIIDHQIRKKMILEQIEKIEIEKKVNVIIEDELLEEVIHLIEYPTVLYGEFEEKFLELPDKVLITSMKEHQRYFPVENDTNDLMNMFLTVRNGDDKGIENVRAGNEKVLRARLADAMFFYQADQKESLADKVSSLKNIIFHEGLGTIYDKVLRIKDLVKDLGDQLEVAETEIEYASRAAYLSKADLVTEMVNEFAKLQGVMGKKYALLSGEEEPVAQAIFEHYLPAFSGDCLPASQAGRLLSIADKIDNIVACFNLNLIPTGSQDPYALRRQAQGIIDITVDSGLEIQLDDLIKLAIDKFAEDNKLQRDKNDLTIEIMDFFKLRLEKLLEEYEIRYDVVAATLKNDCVGINDLLIRGSQLMEFRKEADFDELITAFKRVSNLAKKKETQFELVTDYFIDESEEKLYQAYLKVRQEVKSLCEDRFYKQALIEISSLKGLIDEFFNSVMVMVDNKDVKNNRLTLLEKIAELPENIADLTEIVVD